MNYEDILKREDKRLRSLLTNYSGRHLLQLSDHILLSLTVSPISHKIRISNTSPPVNSTPSILQGFQDVLRHTRSKEQSPVQQHHILKADGINHPFLQSTYTHLPFASESINLVLLPHTLEFDKNAKLVLSESWRVLTPNGHLILLGINPLSLWGVYRLFASHKKLAWNGYFYTIQTICQWIQYLGGEICHTESFLFRPPLSSRLGKWLFDKLFFLEKISPWLFPYLGGIYLIIAQKRVRRPSRLSFVWHFSPVLTKALAPRGAHYG
ncbi:MAG: methyltransferase domain-containing protein [Pseudomonadota bacterium]